jgi:hypothetical protein
MLAAAEEEAVAQAAFAARSFNESGGVENPGSVSELSPASKARYDRRDSVMAAPTLAISSPSQRSGMSNVGKLFNARKSGSGWEPFSPMSPSAGKGLSGFQELPRPNKGHVLRPGAMAADDEEALKATAAIHDAVVRHYAKPAALASAFLPFKVPLFDW